jgi:hypothetical protein
MIRHRPDLETEVWENKVYGAKQVLLGNGLASKGMKKENL